MFRQTAHIVYIHRNISIHRYIGCLHEIEIKKIKNLIGRINRLDTNDNVFFTITKTPSHLLLDLAYFDEPRRSVIQVDNYVHTRTMYNIWNWQ